MSIMGRPRKDIDKDMFERLCGIMCTLSEIAGFFQCSEDTIENWCKRTYDTTFSDIYKVFSANGKISLRRMQFKQAEKSYAMAIWLGKQYLGQTDKIINVDIAKGEEQAKELLKNIREMVELDNEDEQETT